MIYKILYISLFIVLNRIDIVILIVLCFFINECIKK